MKLRITRRQLVKGALAAPLVMTVRSASATGWSMSSNKACKWKDEQKYHDKNVYKFKKYKNEDEWLRVEVQICQIEKKDSKGKYREVDGEHFKGNTNCWWKLEKVGADCNCIKKSDHTDSNCRVKKNLRKEWGLVACDDDGNVKGFHWEHSNYSPVTRSCWSSLKGMST